MSTTCYAAVLALGVTMVAGGSACSESFTLVDGTTRAAIAIPASPTATESLAAGEIAKYVELMSGVKLAIIETASAPAGAIVLRRNDTGLGDEGYSIEISSGRLILTGARDRSVVYAAYDLLGRLGCKWLAPEYSFYGDSSEVVPKQSKLTLDIGKPIAEKPAMKFRKLYVEEGHSHNAENLKQMIEWMSKTRRNTLVVPTDYQGGGRVKWDNWREALTPELRKRDIQIEVGGHGYQNFINADMPEVKAHPGWLGVDETGERSAKRHIVFCTSNADAVRFLTRNVVAYLKARPEIDIFDFWPPDGARWCECETCKAMGTPADRQAKLVGQVISEARKQGVTARFECIAYAVYTDPPANPPMDPSVLIDFCPIAQCFEAQINDPSSKQNAGYAGDLQAWRKAYKGDISIYSYYRKYAWDSLPVILPHYMQADMQWYAEVGTNGISSYSEPGDWRTYELNHYVLSHLSWNPDCDVDALIDDFCAARYPKCSDAVKALLMAMEETVRRGCRIPGTKLKSPAELQGHIDKLTQAAAPLKDFAKDPAVAALLAATDYALKDMAILKQRSEGGSETDRAAMVDELAEFLAGHEGEGVFVVGSRLSADRLKKDYGIPASK